MYIKFTYIYIYIHIDIFFLCVCLKLVQCSSPFTNYIINHFFSQDIPFNT